MAQHKQHQTPRSGQAPSKPVPTEQAPQRKTEKDLDDTLDQSFPASDPPANSGTTRV